MRVIGIDPGSSVTGYGVLDDAGRDPRVIVAGVIKTGRGALALRLWRILEEVERLLVDHQPEAMAVEEIFFARNAKSAMVLGHARGAALAAAGRAKIEVFEYAPRKVKQTVTGYGGAGKEQVRDILRATLGQIPDQLDASDALAVALCHLRWADAPRPEGAR